MIFSFQPLPGLVSKQNPKTKYIVFLLFLSFLFRPSAVSALQVPLDGGKALPDSTQKSLKKDTVANYSKAIVAPTQKRFGRAALFFGISEFTPYSFDRFVTKKDYAQNNFGDIAHNLSPGSWVFDNDPFQTNQFGHPYHGNFFYNSFRVNGYSFWQSVPAAFAGSFIWETAGENTAPAINDFINTGYGGIILGEMTYRLSNKIVNNRTVGFKRQVTEVLGLLIDPLNGLNRIADGKWGKLSANAKERDSSKIYAEFDVGGRRFSINNTKGKFGLYGHIRLLYGTPYEEYRRPFSNIAINTEFGTDDSAKVNVISVYGSIAGWNIAMKEKTDQVLVISANYDYIRNEAFFFGGQSIRANLISNYTITDKLKVNTAFNTGIVILGAIPDKYVTDSRNYDYGSGVAYSLSGGIEVDGKLTFNLNYRGGWLGTINGYSSHYLLNIATAEFSYRIIKSFAFAAESGYLNLRTFYKDNSQNVSGTYPYIRVSARYIISP